MAAEVVEPIEIRFTFDAAILAEIARERIAQEMKFPDQHLPLVHPLVMGRDAGVAAMIHTVPMTRTARMNVAARVEDGMISWADVLVEEVAEFVECRGDLRESRAEMVQVAAVALRILEDIDRMLEDDERRDVAAEIALNAEES